VSVYMSNGVVLTVNAVDLSTLTSSVTINRAFEELIVTSMGDTGQKQVKGLEASSISIEFFNDDASSKTLQTLNSTWGTNTTVTVKQTSAATSATNPLYTMTCLINGITPINGAVGDLSTQSVTWNVSGNIVITTS